MINYSGRNNGLRALVTVENYLKKIGWAPKKTDIEEVLLVDLHEENLPIINVHFDIRIEYERFLIYFNFKDYCTIKSREETIKFITMANFDLVIGNFELNIENGLVRFKSSIDFTQVVLSDNLIRNMIKSSMDVIEQYAKALYSVIIGKSKANDALKQAENDI